MLFMRNKHIHTLSYKHLLSLERVGVVERKALCTHAAIHEKDNDNDDVIYNIPTICTVLTNDLTLGQQTQMPCDQLCASEKRVKRDIGAQIKSCVEFYDIAYANAKYSRHKTSDTLGSHYLYSLPSGSNPDILYPLNYKCMHM